MAVGASHAPRVQCGFVITDVAKRAERLQRGAGWKAMLGGGRAGHIRREYGAKAAQDRDLMGALSIVHGGHEESDMTE